MTVEEQQKRLPVLEGSQQAAEERIIRKSNNNYEVSERLVDVEKYSRKLCLIFSNMDYSFDKNPISFKLSFFPSFCK